MLEVNKALIELNGTMAVQVINFLILVWLMNRLLVKPIGRVITKREGRISNWFKEAASHNAETTEMLEDYNRVIESTAREVSARQEEKREKVKEEVTREVSATSDRAAKLVSEAEENLKREVARVREELRGQADHLAIEVVSKVLGRAAS